MNKTEKGELISALADGELQDETLRRALQELEDAELQSTWDTYHAIGDVLRSPDLAATASSATFLGRLRPALAREAVGAAAVEGLRPVAAGSAAPSAGAGRSAAANDRRWKIAAGLASVAAVLAVGWNVSGLGAGNAQQPQLAAAPATPAAVLASGERNPMLRDARLDEFLAAHRQFGSATAIQMPTGSVRNAAFETPAR